MKAQWRTMPLGDVAEFIRGITFKPSDVVGLGEPGSIACFRTKNVQSEIDLEDVLAVPHRFASPGKLLGEGDILVSTANSWNLVGKCSWVPKLPWEATLGGFIAALRADPSKVDCRYLFRWFSLPATQAKVRSCARQTTNIANLNFEQCLRLVLPLPPLSEQRRIAAILDQADALRRARREVLSRLSKFPGVLFSTTFGDPIQNQHQHPVAALSALLDPTRPITYGILKPGPEMPAGVPYIRVVDMKDGHVEVGSVRRTSNEIAHQYRRSTLRAGDLLISIRGHVGRTAFTPEVLDGANITQDTARLAVKGANPVFVRCLLDHQSSARWMAARTRGAAVKGINLGDLKQMPIILPPRNEQDRFALEVEQTEKLAVAAKHQLARLDALFASLQHRAFNGELTRAHDRVLEPA